MSEAGGGACGERVGAAAGRKLGMGRRGVPGPLGGVAGLGAPLAGLGGCRVMRRVAGGGGGGGGGDGVGVPGLAGERAVGLARFWGFW